MVKHTGMKKIAVLALDCMAENLANDLGISRQDAYLWLYSALQSQVVYNEVLEQINYYNDTRVTSIEN